MTDFEGVVPALAKALDKRGYTKLTPVQIAMLAPELETADALVSAQTGSGKTVAFGLALAPTIFEGADRFVQANAPLALVIAPTRELALQVKRELEWLYEETGAIIASCVGGMDMRMERRTLARGAHIVVGTPGRLRDHIERNSLDMTGMRAVVLDEADEMLDLGFRDDLEYMLDTAPDTRRTLMFSATVPKSIAGMAKRYQRNAIRVETKSAEKQHQDIEYRALTVSPSDKENAIINVIRYFEAKNTIIFCSTRAAVNHLKSRLNNRGFSVVALSGELSQNERSHALQAMRDGRARVCVATDVASRGIDLPGLELVIHADIPKNKEILLHRSGRTGRAGRKGVCAIIVPYNARRRTERLLDGAKIDAAWAKPPSLEEIVARDRDRFLNDPALTEPITDDERPFVDELMGRHKAEFLAAALVRLQQSGQPAPEELSDAGPERGPRQGRDRGERGERGDRPEKKRQDFSNGQWVSLSVGRKHKAEPRWILPTLCRAGHITKKDIGAIRIHEDETHVELSPTVIDQFFEALGPSRKLEKTITVDKLRGPAPAAESSRSNRNFGDKKPYEGSRSEGRSEGRSRDRSRGDGSRDRSEGRSSGRSDFKRSDSRKPEGKSEWRGKSDGGRPSRDSKPARDAKPGQKRSFSEGRDNRSFDKSASKSVEAQRPKTETPSADKEAAKEGKKKKPKWTADQKRARDDAKKVAGDKPAAKAKAPSKKDSSGDGPLKRK
ncbi:MAG: DEAD/DEAH box helicase [Kordiimonadaceae bacterium]|nr:DEAD/DEAH box helicase [Kordiimonadaceae bacterium]